MTFHRYVAIGDSSTEGLDDPDGHGGYRGWANRLADRIAGLQGSLLYANLGIRGRSTRQILEQQLETALAMRPDLATLFSGTNDVLAWQFDAPRVAADMEYMQRALIAGGATVVTFTLPDLTPLMPVARLIAPRIRAMNDALRAAAARTGAILVDFAAYPVATDERLWSGDRIHANADGHARIAAALAHALGLPGTDEAWKEPLAPPPARSTAESIAHEFTWVRQHLCPWIVQGVSGAARGEVRFPKRPGLEALVAGPAGRGAAGATGRPG